MKNMFNSLPFYCNSKIKSIWFTISFTSSSRLTSSPHHHHPHFSSYEISLVTFFFCVRRAPTTTLAQSASRLFQDCQFLTQPRYFTQESEFFFHSFGIFFFSSRVVLRWFFFSLFFFLPWTHFQRLNRWILLNLPRYFCTKAIPLHCLDDLSLLSHSQTSSRTDLGWNFKFPLRHSREINDPSILH